MKTIDAIREKLIKGLNPSEIDVKDVSYKHAGHSGWRPGGETHFEVTMKAKVFEGKSAIQRHRMVNKILATELANKIHALQLDLQS